MSMDFLLRRVGETLWSTPSTNRYKDEQTLQVLIKQSPQLLGTFEVGSVFVDELPINSTGYVDLCGVGPSGSITLVECKLGSNSEIRREVVGQILAYAAGLWRYSYEDFEKSFQLRLGSRERLVDTLRNVNEESATWDDDSFKNAVISNLTEGRFNLVIVVDQITDELKRIVPYINSHTLPEVNFYALEVAYGQHADVEIIHPVTFGIESVEAKRLRNKNVWSEADYFDLLKPHGPVVRNTIDRLYAHAVKHGAIFVSGRGAEPSLGARFILNDKRTTIWTSYFTLAGPSIDINFAWFRESFQHPALEKFVAELSALPGVAAYYKDVSPNFRVRPSVPIKACFLSATSVDRLILAMDDLLQGELERIESTS